MTAGAVDLGEKPSVVSAIVKYHLTERGRQVIIDAMDVHAGKGICMGPSNYLGRAYQATPIAITVEGANILTRSMIIFGQGAIRGHPVRAEGDRGDAGARRREGAARTFDAAFFGHVSFVVSNKARAFWMGLTEARFVSAPGRPAHPPLLPAAHAALQRVRVHGGRRDVRAGRRAQAARAAVGAAGRHPLQPLSRFVRAEALRGRRTPRRRTCRSCTGRCGTRSVADRGRVPRLLRESPQSLCRLVAPGIDISASPCTDGNSRRRATGWVRRSWVCCSPRGPRASG